MTHTRRSILRGATALSVGLVTLSTTRMAISHTKLEPKPPERVGLNDAAFVQWHVDHSVKLPPGTYWLHSQVTVDADRLWVVGS